jgi:hypothetical protein
MENPESFNQKMEALKGEIGTLMVKEPGHFKHDHFDIEELTGSDGAIWEEIKNGTLTKEELKEYAEEVGASGVASRATFLAMVRNKALALFMNRETENRKRKQ